MIMIKELFLNNRSIFLFLLFMGFSSAFAQKYTYEVYASVDMDVTTGELIGQAVQKSIVIVHDCDNNILYDENGSKYSLYNKRNSVSGLTHFVTYDAIDSHMVKYVVTFSETDLEDPEFKYNIIIYPLGSHQGTMFFCIKI